MLKNVYHAYFLLCNHCIKKVTDRFYKLILLLAFIVFNNIVQHCTPDSDSTILFNILDRYEQYQKYRQQNIVSACYTAGSHLFAVYIAFALGLGYVARLGRWGGVRETIETYVHCCSMSIEECFMTG